MSLIGRRAWMKAAAVGLGGVPLCGWLPAFAERVAADPARRRHFILLWMGGGPAQTDTFDMKAEHANGGEFKEIATNVPGVRFSEHLPQLAQQADKLAIVRSLRTKEGDHARGTYLMQTGQRPMGQLTYPTVSCALGKMLGAESDVLPRCVSVAPYQAPGGQPVGPGFLGPKFTPLVVASRGNVPAVGNQTANSFAQLKIDALEPPAAVSVNELTRRRALWTVLQQEFVDQHRGGAALAHDTVYQRSMNTMNKEMAEAFDLTKEPDELREAYGRGVFGQGCLMARRLVERGVPVVEVALGGWDTHVKGFDALKPLSAELDAGWATLLKDLERQGLLASTTILWMGEFGRTPQINGTAGRDHFPAAWSCVFAGGGIAGGQAFGRTSGDGLRVEDSPVDAGDVLSTVFKAVGVNPQTESGGRPIKLVEGNPIEGVLA